MTTTRDALDGGALVLEQPARGYRFNVDSVHLADFAGPCRGVVFDLGAGVGTIGLLLAARGHAEEVVLVERDVERATLAASNAAATPSRVRAECADVLAAAEAHRGEASVVVCNPPYFMPDSGRAARPDRHDARFGDVDLFVRAARVLLGSRGRACFVYPSREWVSLSLSMRQVGLEPKRLRHVHASARSASRVVLVEARPGKPGGLVVESPLFES